MLVRRRTSPARWDFTGWFVNAVGDELVELVPQ